MNRIHHFNGPRRNALLAAIVIFFATPLSHAACSAVDLKRYPGVMPATDQWAKSHNLFFTSSTRDAIAAAFCEAALSAQSSPHTGDKEINRVADKVITEYLDLEFDTSRQMKTMEAVLDTALGVSGMARPVVREFAHVALVYEGDPDQVKIGDDTSAPRASAFVLSGTVKIEGFKNGHGVCSGSADVKKGIPVEIRCKKTS